MPNRRHFAMLAEFDNPEEFLVAVRKTRAAGYTRMDAYSPNPVEGLSEAMELGQTPIPKIVLTGAIFGAILGYFIQYWATTIDYPINVAGRPLHSWPAFIPITFEMAVLVGGLFAVIFGVLALNGLPRPYHPLFNLPAFDRASRDRYFVCIEAGDERFDLKETRKFLESLSPLEVHDVKD